MNERIKRLRHYIFTKQHHPLRRTAEEVGLSGMAEEMKAAGMSFQMRAAIRLKRMLEAETPVLLPEERIAVTRTIMDIPSIYTKEEWDDIRSSHYLHEKGDLCNVSPNYEAMLRKGLGQMLREVTERQKDSDLTPMQQDFLESEAVCLRAIQDFIRRYAEKADAEGDVALAETLRAIKSDAPQTLRQALQLLRVMHFCLWEAGHYHNTLGRFDQYIYIYYIKGIESGTCSREEAKELIEEFFLMCNKDSDLYPGMQQGDNGQSIVLAGRSASGEYLWNEVSKICLESSYELELIDPKINIRVDSETPEEIFTLGSQLTKIGLGFPQYSNDDVVIPGLHRLGYSPEDAYNYVVAACWEFIIPGQAVDIPWHRCRAACRMREGRVNERGGIYRAGTGTAMYYIWHATELGATPDGRKSSEMIPANYSPSLFIREKGPLSVIKSFAKPNLERVINGGPLTLEFDQSNLPWRRGCGEARADTERISHGIIVEIIHEINQSNR